MPFRYVLGLLFCFATPPSVFCEELQNIPDQVYPELEYIFNLAQSEDVADPGQVAGLIEYIRTAEVGSSSRLTTRNGASGAFHSFSIRGNLGHIMDYSYNPNIPAYVTAPSSLSKHEWLTTEMERELQSLPREVDSPMEIRLLRGKDREIITPDTNTGGYYEYIQDRLVVLLPGDTGPVLISASIQSDVSGVGKKGCVVGADTEWNYLYSGKTGLNKSGMGWVNSYMYHANSVIVYIADSAEKVVHIGSFKWLNAGWAKVNLVKSSHILNGIKRFASDFKAVLEAPSLPGPSELADQYSVLLQSDKKHLRQAVSVYLQALVDAGSSAVRSNPFKKMLTSGEYLENMSHDEMVKVLMLEYVKRSIGKNSLVSLVPHPLQKDKG